MIIFGVIGGILFLKVSLKRGKQSKSAYNMRIIFGIGFIFSALGAWGQSSNIPLHGPGNTMLERLEIKSGIQAPFHPETKAFARKDAFDYAMLLDTANAPLTKLDRSDLQYLFDDNNEWLPDTSKWKTRNRKKVLRAFYPCPANLFEVNTPDFTLRANPMIQLAAGRQQNDAELIFVNQRGLEVRGTVDKKVFFYTNLIESQARFPNYMQQWIDEYRSIPGVGFFKGYRPRIFEVQNGYDFNVATAYVGVPISKHISFQLGHGKHFIGNGIRSLFLSDVGNFAFYAKLNTRVWKFHYQNLFMELSPISQALLTTSERLPKKYAAIHYLNYRITPSLAVGLYEATIFNRSRQFELQYLNPVILYRTIEGMIGSPDNVLLGLDLRWNFLKRFQVYGQLMIDEFIYAQLVNPKQKGWWGNKFGTQVGVKYINAFGVDHLDIQLEWNRVRPYTYSHYDSLNSYSHYNQPLAHPLWSNFNELIGKVRYQPTRRLQLQGWYMFSAQGENGLNANWGANPLLGYTTRVKEYGNVQGQGVGARTRLLNTDISWMLYHNIYLDAKLLWRHKNSVDDSRDLNTFVFTFGVRMNFWSPENLF
jgi:hypothetical protein